MKNYLIKNLGVKKKIILIVLSLTIISFSIIILFNIYSSRKIATENAKILLETNAKNYANSLTSEFEIALNLNKALNSSMLSMKRDKVVNRTAIIRIMQSIINTNPYFEGIWTCWEPNALDENDAEFINTDHHDNTGRFIPYIYKSGESIKAIALKNYNIPGAGNFYLTSKGLDEDIITEPYQFYSDANKKIGIGV